MFILLLPLKLKANGEKVYFFIPIILGVLLNGCIQTNYPFSETQITFSPYNHSLDNNDNFSPDNMWLVYDTRTNNGGIRRGKTIEKVNISTKEIVTIYSAPGASETGPGTGAVSYHPIENKIIFIQGLLNHSKDKTYEKWRRFGMLVDEDNPTHPIVTDARDVLFPFTSGALRGGTHRHEFSGDGQWIGFTYNDAVMADKGKKYNLRTIGVTKLNHPVSINGENDRENFSGAGTSALVVRVTSEPGPGSDEISHAADDSWVGKHGYKKPDGTMQLARAFLGTVLSTGRKNVKELFIVDIPADLTNPGSFGPLSGTTDIMPMPPEGTLQRRLTFTASSPFPGCSGIVRSNPEGTTIAYLAKDKNGIDQVFLMSPLGDNPRQLTSFDNPVQSGVRWHPDGSHVCFLWNNSIVITNVKDKSWEKIISPTQPKPSALVWSHDGRTIAYNRNIPDEKSGKSFAQIFVIFINDNYLP